ncbi:MAG: glucokinase [Rubrivivax sp.]|nr:glucokinase [Rubrivivax sp.]
MSATATATGAAPRLLADIGGTNARFAWQAQAGAAVEQVRTLSCADHATLDHAIQRYLQDTGQPVPPACAIAIATAVVGDQVAMTNHHWAFSIAALKAQLGLQQLLVINDFTALALALPSLQPDETWQLGGTAARPGWAIGLIGPGTGLGVSGLLPDGRGGWLPLQGEGGHATMAGTTARECAVLALLTQWHGHASAERAVSGPGLVDIHRALGVLDGLPEQTASPTAADITSAALEGSDARSLETLELFCAYLGIAAGNLALALGAKGGVYIGGGIVPRLGHWFTRSAFRERFEAKGRLSSFLHEIPVFVIDARSSPAFLGAANALDSSAPFEGWAR